MWQDICISHVFECRAALHPLFSSGIRADAKTEVSCLPLLPASHLSSHISYARGTAVGICDFLALALSYMVQRIWQTR